MRLKQVLLFIFIAQFISISSLAQSNNVKDSALFFVAFNFSYTAQWPQFDMAERFGNNSAIGLIVDVKTKRNFIYGIEGSFLFGGDIRNETDVLSLIRDENGQVINGAGEYADVFLEQRGFTTRALAGKLFPVLSPNQNSGPYFLLSAGFLQHRIQIRDLQNTVPQLSGDYRKGYDRLVNGFMFSQFVGYKYNSNNRLINFFAGVEFIQGFTQDARTYNFDELQPTNENRRDHFLGVKFGWSIPLYKKQPKDFYFY